MYLNILMIVLRLKNDYIFQNKSVQPSCGMPSGSSPLFSNPDLGLDYWSFVISQSEIPSPHIRLAIGTKVLFKMFLDENFWRAQKYSSQLLGLLPLFTETMSHKNGQIHQLYFNLCVSMQCCLLAIMDIWHLDLQVIL